MKDLDNYIHLQNLRSKIINNFFEIYSDYKIMDSLELGNDEDITLDFASCTICSAKKNIIDHKKGENYVMYQYCLRNNQINMLKSCVEQSDYMSFFTMLGGYHYIDESEDWKDEYNKIIYRQISFFRKLYPQNKIRLTIPEQYIGLLAIYYSTLKFLENNNCEICYSKVDGDNLKWKYGIQDVQGYGTRWEVYNNLNGYINCGNDILIYQNNKPIGIDFGSGLETLVSVYNDHKNLLYSNLVCSDFIKEFCYGNVFNEKLIDCLTSLLCINNNKKYKSFRIKYLIYIYIRIICAITIINCINDEKLELIIKNLCNNLDINYNIIVEEIINKIHEHQKFLYDLSNSNKGEYLIAKLKEGILPFAMRKYKKNVTDIEIYALEVIRERENKNVKTRKIEKR